MKQYRTIEQMCSDAHSITLIKRHTHQFQPHLITQPLNNRLNITESTVNKHCLGACLKQ